jgi:hypothetical protein
MRHEYFQKRDPLGNLRNRCRKCGAWESDAGIRCSVMNDVEMNDQIDRIAAAVVKNQKDEEDKGNRIYVVGIPF